MENDLDILIAAAKDAIPQSEHPAEDTASNWAWQIRNLGLDWSLLKADNEAMKQELNSLRKDADRYRWFRANLDANDDFPLMEHKKGIDYGVKQYGALDAAIDTELAK
jgi:hypothetical protein